MREVALVMPMAGRGSRFGGSQSAPKPLIEVGGRPFFAWAIDSVARSVVVTELVTVVLREHVSEFSIDVRIRERYPHCRIVVVDAVTSGAAETALIGLEAVRGDGVIAINDCDHAFDAKGLMDRLSELQAKRGDGLLLGFRSANPAYSYARFAADGEIIGTVEKVVASEFALAGCFFFANRAVFRACYEPYVRQCPYRESYVSGLYNVMIASGRKVLFHELVRHVPFGTPAELAGVDPCELASIAAAKP